MAVAIYCIEDINGLKYIGSTTQELYNRMACHRYEKKNNKYCSSCKLDLYNCKYYVLEKCQESNRKKREKYWINNTNCVNYMKLNFERDKWNRKNYLILRKDYNNTWGGDRRYHNNLLCIDVNLFN